MKTRRTTIGGRIQFETYQSIILVVVLLVVVYGHLSAYVVIPATLVLVKQCTMYTKKKKLPSLNAALYEMFTQWLLTVRGSV